MPKPSDADRSRECARELRLSVAWFKGQPSSAAVGYYCYPATELAARLRLLAKSLSQVQHLLPAELQQALVPSTPAIHQSPGDRKHFTGDTVRKVCERFEAQASFLETLLPNKPSEPTESMGPLSIQQWAEVFGIHRNTMSKWLNTGQVQAKHVGGLWYVETRELSPEQREIVAQL